MPPTDAKRLFCIARRVYLCTARNRAEAIAVLTPDTALNEHLGLSGDDVDDLFRDVARFYQIDWSQFDFHTYFESEAPSILGIVSLPIWAFLYLINLALHLFGQESPILVPRVRRLLTGGHRPFRLGAFVLSAYAGKWTDDSADLTAINDELTAWQRKFQARLEYRLQSRKRRGSFA